MLVALGCIVAVALGAIVCSCFRCYIVAVVFRCYSCFRCVGSCFRCYSCLSALALGDIVSVALGAI